MADWCKDIMSETNVFRYMIKVDKKPETFFTYFPFNKTVFFLRDLSCTEETISDLPNWNISTDNVCYLNNT